MTSSSTASPSFSGTISLTPTATVTNTRSRSVTATVSGSNTPFPSPVVVVTTLSTTTFVATLNFTKRGAHEIIQLHIANDQSTDALVPFTVLVTPIGNGGGATVFMKHGAIPTTTDFDLSSQVATGINNLTATTNGLQYLMFVGLTNGSALVQITQTSSPPVGVSNPATPAPPAIAYWVWIIVAVGGFLLLIVIVAMVCCLKFERERKARAKKGKPALSPAPAPGVARPKGFIPPAPSPTSSPKRAPSNDMQMSPQRSLDSGPWPPPPGMPPEQVQRRHQLLIQMAPGQRAAWLASEKEQWRAEQQRMRARQTMAEQSPPPPLPRSQITRQADAEQRTMAPPPFPSTLALPPSSSLNQSAASTQLAPANTQSVVAAPPPGHGDVHICVQDYAPVNPDELVLTAGESYRVLSRFEDGWGTAINRQGLQGFVPLNMLEPVGPASSTGGATVTIASPSAVTVTVGNQPISVALTPATMTAMPLPPVSSPASPAAAAAADLNGSAPRMDIETQTPGRSALGPREAARLPLDAASVLSVPAAQAAATAASAPGSSVSSVAGSASPPQAPASPERITPRRRDREERPLSGERARPRESPQRRRPPSSPPVEECRALQDYFPERRDELPLRAGAVVTVVARYPDGWGRCRDQYGAEGMAPLNFLAPKFGPTPQRYGFAAPPPTTAVSPYGTLPLGGYGAPGQQQQQPLPQAQSPPFGPASQGGSPFWGAPRAYAAPVGTGGIDFTALMTQPMSPSVFERGVAK